MYLFGDFQGEQKTFGGALAFRLMGLLVIAFGILSVEPLASSLSLIYRAGANVVNAHLG
jgi:hypothetical protein